MDELENIYMADDAISGADVYKPVTDWTLDKLNKPFEPLFNVKPSGFFPEKNNSPGAQAWRETFPENPPMTPGEIECRTLAPRVKERSSDGGLTMNKRPFLESQHQGLFGKTVEPCVSERGAETFKQDFTNTMSQTADWINKGGAALESSINPAENRNWQNMPSMQLGKEFKAQPQRRDYGVPKNQEFSIDRQYKPGLAKDLSDHLMDPVYGEAGQAASADLKNRYVSTYSAINGKDLWNRLKNDFGVEQAGEIIGRLGYFSGVRGNPTFSGNEVIRFTPNEAERAFQKMEQENSYLDSPDNPASSAHGFDFGRQPEKQAMSLRPTYDEYGYDYEPGSDPRQYGVPKNTRFSTDQTYTPEMIEDISRIVTDPAYGPKGEKMAAELRHFLIDSDQYPITGYGLYNRMLQDFGPERANEIIRRLDYFTGIEGVDPYGEVDFQTGPGEGYPSLFR